MVGIRKDAAIKEFKFPPSVAQKSVHKIIDKRNRATKLPEALFTLTDEQRKELLEQPKLVRPSFTSMHGMKKLESPIRASKRLCGFCLELSKILPPWSILPQGALLG